ncbi:pesticin C-terminus-like muramidase [Pseudomonas aeruginosa]|uniref:pesticin C-terminus-like muramidase n=1 Tax=Pseudomonas aeruginosa TaxID=287 RepID=UPI00222F91E7|nr:pesticin C-terminus-like muramidase [Pseudomonas aeruginosa]HBO0799789.1 pesticin domain-containing protein [Pseudomonas aeruginosa]HBO1471923.1 pesticin domain-containing protein [Pseudomonas aeruginosa]HBO7099527.1 pesticin domain-containing protein [Pseudomonas aeruginosa]HBP5204596.1 pesticin domain-containing protein [Pseudomonas aeruginosa]HCF5279433.1 pesticin domain-containing protein [Pseudomonas aeruginosa]
MADEVLRKLEAEVLSLLAPFEKEVRFDALIEESPVVIIGYMDLVPPEINDTWLTNWSVAARTGIAQSLIDSINTTIGRPVVVTDHYFRGHEVSIRTVPETGGSNLINMSDLSARLNSQINTFIQDRIDEDKDAKVSLIQQSLESLAAEQVNSDFTARHELPAGFRPNTVLIPDLGESAITVGYGFDLGRHGEQELISMGIPVSTRDKIRPGLGVSRDDPQAYTALSLIIPSFTDDDGMVLFSAKLNRVTGAVRTKFSDVWADLPPSVRTIVVDVYYNFGQNKNFPVFEQAVRDRNWAGLVHELRNWDGHPNVLGDYRTNRLNDRADYLQQALGLPN